MAILRSKDGTFFNVPDEKLEEHKIAPEKLRETLKEAGHLEGPPKMPRKCPPPKHPHHHPHKLPSPVNINVFVGGEKPRKHSPVPKEEGDVRGYSAYDGYCSNCSSCSWGGYYNYGCSAGGSCSVTHTAIETGAELTGSEGCSSCSW